MLLVGWLMIAGGLLAAAGGAIAWTYDVRLLAAILWFTAIDLVGSAFVINWRATRPLKPPEIETKS